MVPRQHRPGLPEIRTQISGLLQIEAELQEIVQLVGSDALPVDQQLTLEVARMIREFFLQQNGFDPVDAYCDIKLQYEMAKAICPSRKPPRPPWPTVRCSTMSSTFPPAQT